MPQIASAVLEEPEAAVRLSPDDQHDALRRVAERLLRAAADPSTRWSLTARADAERVALEMLAQASKG
jgi:hypothetical protein